MICKEDFPINKEFSPALQDLIYNLTQKDPKKRLGSKRGADEIKAHRFFNAIEDWDFVAQRGLTPPIVPRTLLD